MIGLCSSQHLIHLKPIRSCWIIKAADCPILLKFCRLMPWYCPLNYNREQLEGREASSGNAALIFAMYSRIVRRCWARLSRGVHGNHDNTTTMMMTTTTMMMTTMTMMMMMTMMTVTRVTWSTAVSVFEDKKATTNSFSIPFIVTLSLLLSPFLPITL